MKKEWPKCKCTKCGKELILVGATFTDDNIQCKKYICWKCYQ